jgi:GT2 family glycosyltransferase
VDLSIVIINYRMGRHLGPCLKSIFSGEHSVSLEVILVNKPSGDGAEQFADQYKDLILVPYDTFGISLMRNVGIRKTRGRYILILDSDTEVKSGALDELIRFMDSHPKVGIAGGRTIHPDGSLEYSCKRFYTPLTILFRRTPLGAWFPNNPWNRRHLMLDEDHTKTLECDWVAGACLIIRRKTIDQIGLFDDSFYFGFEDVDLCFRAKKAGWSVQYVPQALIVHHVQRKSLGFNKLSWEHLKSGIRFWWKSYVKKSKSQGG